MYCLPKKFSFKGGQTGFKKQEGTKKEGETKEETVESGKQEAGGQATRDGGPPGSRNLSGSAEGRKVECRVGEAA